MHLWLVFSQPKIQGFIIESFALSLRDSLTAVGKTHYFLFQFAWEFVEELLQALFGQMESCRECPHHPPHSIPARSRTIDHHWDFFPHFAPRFPLQNSLVFCTPPWNSEAAWPAPWQ